MPVHEEQREQHGTDTHTGAETALVAVFYVCLFFFTVNILKNSSPNHEDRDEFHQLAFHLHLLGKKKSNTSLSIAQFLLTTVNATVLKWFLFFPFSCDISQHLTFSLSLLLLKACTP